MANVAGGAVLVGLLAASAAAAPPKHSEAELERMYARFRHEFHPDNRAASPRRFAAFKLNVAQAYTLNFEQGINCTDLFDDQRCVFGITKFADSFHDEFAATRLGYRRITLRPHVEVLALDANLSAVSSVDWRQKGALTPVKDQGDCGSCWAFSATEEIESALFMSTGNLKQLSTQQIISCDKQDDGCDGGDTVTAYRYVQKAGGLDLAGDYPDKSHSTGKTGKCSWDGKEAAHVAGFSYATKPCNSGSCKHQNERALAAATAQHGPMSVCVNAGGSGWQLYKQGVYSRKCSAASSDLDHCVQLVGYDATASPPYWILRNSWNTDWGEAGFMRLAMGKNLCGVADEATLVKIQGMERASTVVV
mmetsp:Transcript_141537/g.439997  ORF Transcript_141537/g.439997 Transcript_141537/m.439997 type:complete len:363 (-) Transcript_141537:40-1128(-)